MNQSMVVNHRTVHLVHGINIINRMNYCEAIDRVPFVYIIIWSLRGSFCAAPHHHPQTAIRMERTHFFFFFFVGFYFWYSPVTISSQHKPPICAHLFSSFDPQWLCIQLSWRSNQRTKKRQKHTSVSTEVSISKFTPHSEWKTHHSLTPERRRRSFVICACK